MSGPGFASNAPPRFQYFPCAFRVPSVLGVVCLPRKLLEKHNRIRKKAQPHSSKEKSNQQEASLGQFRGQARNKSPEAPPCVGSCGTPIRTKAAPFTDSTIVGRDLLLLPPGVNAVPSSSFRRRVLVQLNDGAPSHSPSILSSDGALAGVAPMKDGDEDKQV